MTERAQNEDFRRKPEIFADSPLLLEIQALGGRRKPQETADFRRKPKIFAEKGNRRLGSVTLGASPLARPYQISIFQCFFKTVSDPKITYEKLPNLRRGCYQTEFQVTNLLAVKNVVKFPATNFKLILPCSDLF